MVCLIRSMKTGYKVELFCCAELQSRIFTLYLEYKPLHGRNIRAGAVRDCGGLNKVHLTLMYA